MATEDVPQQILAVDDQPTNLEVLARVLGEQGLKIRTVTSGARALEAARLSPPDCILLDVGMPGMDGYAVCGELQADDKLRHIPIIFLTAHDDPEHKVRAFAAGGRDYISKPFQAEEVAARVRNQLRIKDLEDRLRKQHEAVTEANLGLREATALKARVSAMLVHDIRNPLMVIGAILDGPMDGEALADARLAYKRMGELLKEMMELARNDYTELERRHVPLDLNEIVRGVIRLTGNVAAARGITLGARTSPEPLIVRGDPGQLERVITNIVGNALKFTPPQGRVDVSVERESGAGVEAGLNYGRVRVSDNGPGIAPDEMPFIFDAYRQAPSAEVAGGVGLGLAIAARFVARHGGRIRVYSRLGVGSEFHIQIPI